MLKSTKIVFEHPLKHLPPNERLHSYYKDCATLPSDKSDRAERQQPKNAHSGSKPRTTPTPEAQDFAFVSRVTMSSANKTIRSRLLDGEASRKDCRTKESKEAGAETEPYEMGLGLLVKQIKPCFVDQKFLNVLNDQVNNRLASDTKKSQFSSELLFRLENRTKRKQEQASRPRPHISFMNRTLLQLKNKQRSRPSQPRTVSDRDHYTKSVCKSAFNKFSVVDGTNKVYEQRFYYYRQFLHLVTFAHGRTLQMESEGVKKYKAFVGPGNNSGLIKRLLRRRFWWSVESERTSDTNFTWTQIKVNEVFERQPRSCVEVKVEDQTVSRKKLAKFTQLLTASDIKRYIQIAERSKVRSFSQLVVAFGREHGLSPFRPDADIVMHNHLKNNFLIGNKKTLFYNLRAYYEMMGQQVFQYLPLTFHVKRGAEDPEFRSFQHYFKLRREQQRLAPESRIKNLWIVKPGESSNQGRGIEVVRSLEEVRRIIARGEKHGDGSKKTYIVQQYIDRPTLYQGRKFDIRHYILVSSIHGIRKGYWYEEGYVRTSCKPFELGSRDPMVHLTNDAVQKHDQDYGKFQPANKVSYEDIAEYLRGLGADFYGSVFPRMRRLATDVIQCSAVSMDPDRLQFNFQIFGLDFMLDQNFKPWLIEVNTNPCLELVCPLLAKVIPTMVEHSFRLTLDAVFPPPSNYPNTMKHLAPNNALEKVRFELVYDQRSDSQGVGERLKGKMQGDEKSAENDLFESEQELQDYQLQ